jgi:hypothetical protein
MPHDVKVFRFNLFDWWGAYDLASVKSAYLLQTGVAKEEAFDEDEKEEVQQVAMKKLSIWAVLWAQ